MHSRLKSTTKAGATAPSSTMLAIAAALFFCVGFVPAQAAEQGRAQEKGVVSSTKKKAPRRARGEGRKALAAAARLARVKAGSDARVRSAAIERALEAFAQCAQKFEKDSLVVAEAEFRRAQLMAKLQRTDEACEAFVRAAKRDADAFGARAWLEKAHVERRMKKFSDALASYRQSIALPASNPAGRYEAQARLWTGKTLLTLGRAKDARQGFEDLARDVRVDATMRVRAFDEWAMSWIREKNAESATRVLADASTALATELQAGDKGSELLRKRLARMRSHKSLAKLKAKARPSGTGQSGRSPR